MLYDFKKKIIRYIKDIDMKEKGFNKLALAKHLKGLLLIL